MSIGLFKNKKTTVDIERVVGFRLDDIEHLNAIVQKLGTKLCKPEEVIIKKNTDSLFLYFIVSGKVSVYINDPQLGKLEGGYFVRKEGDIIGEIGVMLKGKRSANVVALDYTILS